MITASRRKMLGDLTREGTRTVLVVFAIAVGIAGFTAVLSAYAILTRELNLGYLATNPASATLRMDAIDDALMAAVLANRDIADADARRIVAGQIKAPDRGWATLKLFVVKDYGHIRINKLVPEQGAWPLKIDEILIERDALQVAGLRIGDAARVKTAAGKEQILRVTGTVHDVGQPQARMENTVYGYVTLNTLAGLGEAPLLDRLNILVAVNPFDQKHIQDVAAEIAKLARSRGHAVHRVDVPVPGEHPHAHIMQLLLLTMSSFGFCILTLSGILVVNLLTALMASQVREIGVMKAIGATSGKVASIYFSQALLLGAAAVVIAVPVGILGGRRLCSAMALFLNFDIASFAVPVWVYLLAAAAGLVVPLLSAAYPVWNGSRIPVRRALTDFGVSADTFGTTAVDRVLVQIGGSLRPLLFALRNSFRRRTRLALTLATLSAGGLFFLSALNIRSSMVRTLDRFFASRKFDLMVNLGGMYPLEKVQRAIAKTPGIVRAEGWTVTEAALPGTDHFTLVALPVKTALLKLDIIEGRDLVPGDTDAIVLNTAAQGRLAVGQTVHSLRIVGIAREQFSPPTGYVPAVHSNMVNSIRLALDRSDHASVDAVKTALDANLEHENVRSQATASTAETRVSFDQHMVMIYVFLVIVSSLIAAIGGLGLMTTMSLNVLERRREMGVLRAIGATPAAVGGIVVAEGVAIGILSWTLAALAAWPLSKVLGELLVKSVFTSGLDFRVEPAGLLVWLAVSIGLGIAASLLPAWSASRTSVREALSHE
jgi:putative ABC transport system permease protein